MSETKTLVGLPKREMSDQVRLRHELRNLQRQIRKLKALGRLRDRVSEAQQLVHDLQQSFTHSRNNH